MENEKEARTGKSFIQFAPTPTTSLMTMADTSLSGSMRRKAGKTQTPLNALPTWLKNNPFFYFYVLVRISFTGM